MLFQAFRALFQNKFHNSLKYWHRNNQNIYYVMLKLTISINDKILFCLNMKLDTKLKSVIAIKFNDVNAMMKRYFLMELKFNFNFNRILCAWSTKYFYHINFENPLRRNVHNRNGVLLVNSVKKVLCHTYTLEMVMVMEFYFLLYIFSQKFLDQCRYVQSIASKPTSIYRQTIWECNSNNKNMEFSFCICILCVYILQNKGVYFFVYKVQKKKKQVSISKFACSIIIS